jgi:hypothetical protein
MRARGGDVVRLAETLALRADPQPRLSRLASRVVTSARRHAGEEPAEDPSSLLAEGGWGPAATSHVRERVY